MVTLGEASVWERSGIPRARALTSRVRARGPALLSQERQAGEGRFFSELASATLHKDLRYRPSCLQPVALVQGRSTVDVFARAIAGEGGLDFFGHIQGDNTPRNGCATRSHARPKG
jgi:hypothetical protein